MSQAHPSSRDSGTVGEALSCRVGAAAVDITPSRVVSMAGYSKASKCGRGALSHLFARALAIEDSRGARVVLCVADLFAATRYVYDRALGILAREVGLTRAEFVLTGTHTHNGPGRIFGSTLYDAIAAGEQGFLPDVADEIAGRIAGAVREALARLEPVTLCVSRVPVWGIARNASLAAFAQNPEARHWHEPGYPGFGVPSGLSETEAAVDPRLTVLSAFAADTGRLSAVFGVFGCHNTALGMSCRQYSADWFGELVDRAGELLEGERGATPFVALAAGAGGDTNCLIPERAQGPALVKEIGGVVARALVDAVPVATGTAEPLVLSVRCAETGLRQPTVDGQPDTRLASEWVYGSAALGGAEDGHSIFHHLGLARAGRQSDCFPAAHPQHPKPRAFGRWHDMIRRLYDLATNEAWLVHAVDLGGHVLVTVPGEPTATAACRIERALLAQDGPNDVTVLGYANDYIGYITTAEEYRAQHYEGASTLYGRNTGKHFEAFCAGLLRDLRIRDEAASAAQ